MNARRLQQFFEFGHNCAVLRIPECGLKEILEDNRFTPWAFSVAERAAFMDGFNARPLRWDRNTLKPIDVRPILHTFNDRNSPDLHKPRGVRQGQIFSEERKKAAGVRAAAFWQSPDDCRLRIKQSEDARKRRDTKDQIVNLRSA